MEYMDLAAAEKCHRKNRKDIIRKYEAKCQRTPDGSLLPPSEITVKDFLPFWVKNYRVSVRPGTKASYAAAIDNHINPALDGIS